VNALQSVLISVTWDDVTNTGLIPYAIVLPQQRSIAKPSFDPAT
jgi:hypothetical protein